MQASFSINIHDKDGDAYQDGIFLFLREGDMLSGKDAKVIIQMDNLVDLDEFIESLVKIRKEIIDTYTAEELP